MTCTLNLTLCVLTESFKYQCVIKRFFTRENWSLILKKNKKKEIGPLKFKKPHYLFLHEEFFFFLRDQSSANQ